MSENKQDTINVDLPIEATYGGCVSVCGLAYTREDWRKVAASPYDNLTSTLAPAVVAWMDRDEWKPLDVPVVGRRIKATLRDGSVKTFEVQSIREGTRWVAVRGTGSEVYHMALVFDSALREPSDIISWEYADEFEPLGLPDVGRTIKATLHDGSEETFEVNEVESTSDWAYVWKADSSDGPRFIQRVQDVGNPGPRDITAWEYVDEWEPLGLPEVGRRIKATLRNGSVEAFKVGKVADDSALAYVSKADSDDEARYIQRVRDVVYPGSFDILVWEYADEEPKAAVITEANLLKLADAIRDLAKAVGK